VVNDAAIRAFASRGWGEAEQGKRAHWAGRFRREGAAATWESAQALRGHVCAVRPDWPTASDRASDLADNVRLKSLFDAARHAFARR
jgi:hypothetical protein